MGQQMFQINFSHYEIGVLAIAMVKEVKQKQNIWKEENRFVNTFNSG